MSEKQMQKEREDARKDLVELGLDASPESVQELIEIRDRAKTPEQRRRKDARCPMCDAPVSWVTALRVARIINVQKARVFQLIAEGRLPGAEKAPGSEGIPSFWKVPLVSVAALLELRRIEKGTD